MNASPFTGPANSSFRSHSRRLLAAAALVCAALLPQPAAASTQPESGPAVHTVTSVDGSGVYHLGRPLL
jgi:hypothetical protein